MSSQSFSSSILSWIHSFGRILARDFVLFFWRLGFSLFIFLMLIFLRFRRTALFPNLLRSDVFVHDLESVAAVFIPLERWSSEQSLVSLISLPLTGVETSLSK
jgi:hypothetical protein